MAIFARLQAIDNKKEDTLGPTVALSLYSNSIWKGAYREYWRDGREQKLPDLDGIVDRRFDGPAARAGRQLGYLARRSCAGKVLLVDE